MKYGKLLVLKEVEPYYSPSGGKHVQYLCRCDCGTEKIILREHLISGATQSCGCIRGRKESELHDVINSRIYRIWGNMINRCTNESNPAFRNYGARGIKVCDEWMTFSNFYAWSTENGYSETLTLDRKDNNDGYNPQNCRWVDTVIQANNKRNNRILKLNEESHTAAEWSRILNVPYKSLHRRISLGWSDERILTQPFRTKSKKNNNL